MNKIYNVIFVLFCSKVKYINLPNRKEKFRRSAVVSGWGTLRSGGRLPDRLRKVRVPIVSERSKLFICFKVTLNIEVIFSLKISLQAGLW